MATELKVMIAIGGLYWLIGQIGLVGKVLSAGTAYGFGNRDETPEFPLWLTRSQKAQSNLLESLPLYYALALTIVLTHHESARTALGSEIFLVGRLAHAVVFTAGITYVRTGAYALAVFGMALMLSGLLSG